MTAEELLEVLRKKRELYEKRLLRVEQERIALRGALTAMAEIMEILESPGEEGRDGEA